MSCKTILPLLALLAVWCISTTECFPPVTDSNSFVVSSTAPSSSEPPTTKKPEHNEAPTLPKIYALKVDTNVTNRYAKTLITSKVRNISPKAQEVAFSVVIPDQAFISGFTMEIDGKSYEAYVQEKEEAKKTYDQAVASGIGAGHVSVSARDSNRFTVSVNIEAESKAVFYLRYEELLKRENEKYEVVLNINPGQPVNNLDVEVSINETRPLKFVKTPSLRSGNEISKNESNLDSEANIEIINKTSAVVKFHPDIQKQKQLGKNLGQKEEHGLSGQFIVQYDVERDPHGGEVLVDGGYFVHFFAPSDLPALPKQVVFILDTSGSMEGIRITQLKEAMNSILSELKEADVFSIVEFSSTVSVWNVENVEVQYVSGNDPWSYEFAEVTTESKNKNKTEQVLPPSFKATPENIEKAKKVVQKLNAYGGTDIQSALQTGLEVVVKNKDFKKHQPIIVFLTDGEATVGEINTDKIVSKITELNSGKSPIFSLSFGEGADRNFLQKISLKNLGFARHIYEAADASLQLEEFYKQISSPLLSNVTFKYVGNVPNITTRAVFPILFDGGEICTAGKIDPEFSPSEVEAWGYHGKIRLIPTVYKSVDKLERLWAFLTVKQILEQRDLAEDKTGPTQEALRLALEYSFVTDVSSLVVVKPNETKAVNTEDASATDYRYPIAAAAGTSTRSKLGFGGALNLAAPISASGFASFSAYPQVLEEPVALAENDYDGDRIYGGALGTFGPISTPHLSSFPTTTVPKQQVDLGQKASDKSDTIYTKLPWLQEKVLENGSIRFYSGTYKLGLNDILENQPECPNSLNGTTGNCTLIQECTQIYEALDDFSKWTQFFCEVEGYAGVCCPVKNEDESQTKGEITLPSSP